MRKAAFTFYGLLGTLTLFFGLLWLKHGDWMPHANNWLLGNDRANFTSIWHMSRDANSTHYSGMNAPFGEHVEFIDFQPLYVNAIRWISSKSSFVHERQIGWLNWGIIFGQMLGCACMYLIFRGLHIPVWLSIWASIGIILVAPQQLQLTAGHLSMANLWIIPVQILLLLTYEARPYRRPYSVLMALSVVAGAMIHYFFFVFSAIFLTLYQVFQVVQKPNFRHFRKRLAHWIVMVLLPFALVHFWLNLGHSVLDRPDLTLEFLESRAALTSVFLPKNVLFSDKIGSENCFYLGILAIIFTLWLLGRRFRFYDKSWDTEAFHRRQKRFLNGICFSGLTMLPLSFGLPFSWADRLIYTDWIGSLHPSFSIGAMSFAWFFVGNILFFYVLWQKSRRILQPWLKIFSLGAGLIILFGEAYLNQRQTILPRKPNFLLDKNAQQRLPKNLDFSKMQAILPLPFYRNMAENGTDFVFQQTQKAAIQTGLPDLGNKFLETSVRQTIKSWQLVLQLLEMPAILDDLPTNQPIALFIDKKMTDSSRVRYEQLWGKARLFWQNDALKIMEMPLDSLRASVAANRQKIREEARSLSLFPSVNDWKSTSSEKNQFLQFTWDLNPSAQAFQGHGSLSAPPTDTTNLFILPMKKGKYVFSIWQFIGDEPAWKTNFLFEEENKNLQIQNLESIQGQKMTISIVGNWIFYEKKFEIDTDGNLFTISILPNIVLKAPIFLDEMMIRNENVDFFKTTDRWIVKNNYWYKK